VHHLGRGTEPPPAQVFGLAFLFKAEFMKEFPCLLASFESLFDRIYVESCLLRCV
jgi:hypothetical protein